MNIVMLTTLVETANRLPPPPKVVPKGHCRHCGKKIGRGLYRHEKACEVKK